MPVSTPNFFVPTPMITQFPESPDPRHAYFRRELIPAITQSDLYPSGLVLE